MPDNQSSTDETSHLFGNRNPPVQVPGWRINLELLKVFGLIMPVAGVVLGFLVSKTVLFCPTCPLDFDTTYIKTLFHFIHTCVWIDNNPGKTPVAILFIIGMVALMLFTVLERERLKRNHAAGETSLKYVATFSKYTWGIRFFSFLVFPMCFVNSPIDPSDPFVDPAHSTWEQLLADKPYRAFVTHYFFYFLWQLACALMAIESGLYHHARGTMPFVRSLTTIKIFLGVTVLVFLYYTLWIVGFLCGFHVFGHTSVDEDGVVHLRQWGYDIMFGYDFLVIVVPILLSVCRAYGLGCKKSEVWVITFSPLKKEEEN